MSDGTTVKLYAPRIHKHNAEQVLESAEGYIERCIEELMILAAHHPTAEECETLGMRVHDLAGLIAEESFRATVAQSIIDFPDECEDELEGGEG